MTIIVLSYKIFIGGDANGQQKKKCNRRTVRRSDICN